MSDEPGPETDPEPEPERKMRFLFALRQRGVTEMKPSMFTATSVPGRAGAFCAPPAAHMKRRPLGAV